MSVPFQCCNRLCKNKLDMQMNAQWDHELGAWKGEQTVNFDEYKSPLYVFGYGSLIWRPGDFLNQYPSFPATAMDCKRLFAQKSLDHRGSRKFPGLVLNLVRDDYLVENGYNLDDDPGNDLVKGPKAKEDCCGLVWLIPDDKIPEVLTYLDTRERGGYSRHYIHVKLQQETPHFACYSVIDALVYTGLEHNPNFFLPSLKLNAERRDFIDLRYRSVVTDTITAAKGLSGTNLEYLLKLQRYLEERGMSDAYINRLAAAVKMRTGPWRRRAIIKNVTAAIPQTRFPTFVSNAPLATVFAIGSNEFHQLHTSHDGLETVPKDITPDIASYFRDMPDYTIGSWMSMQEHEVLAAGSNSAYIYRNRLLLWGSLAKTIRVSLGVDSGNALAIEGVEGAVMNHDSLLILHSSGWVINLGAQVTNAPDAVVLKDNDYFLTEKLLPAWDSRRIFQLVLNDSARQSQPRYEVLKLALGLKHAAAITLCGGLLLWGTPSSKVAHDVNVAWYPPAPTDDFFTKNSTDCSATSMSHLAKFIDVSCGAYHTIAVDDEGRVYTHADAAHAKRMERYGCLGDSLPIRHIPLSIVPSPCKNSTSLITRVHTSTLSVNHVQLPTDIRFVRCSAGWSHNLVRGLDADGKVVCYAWGRNDMTQYLGSPVASTRAVWGLKQPQEEDTDGVGKESDEDLVSETMTTTTNTTTTATEDGASEITSATTYVFSSSISTVSLAAVAQPYSPTEVATNEFSRPQLLQALPERRTFAEVWCGSEFTLAMDAETGELWATGWNEHGNLGTDEETLYEHEESKQLANTTSAASLRSTDSIVRRWRRIMRPKSAATLAAEALLAASSPSSHSKSNKSSIASRFEALKVSVWEGAVACGGAHVLTIAQPPAPKKKALSPRSKSTLSSAL